MSPRTMAASFPPSSSEQGTKRSAQARATERPAATLPVKMLPIYSVYFIFLAAVGAHYAWRIVQLLRGITRLVLVVAQIHAFDVAIACARAAGSGLGGGAAVCDDAGHVGAVPAGVKDLVRCGVGYGVVTGDYPVLAGCIPGQVRVLPQSGVDDGHRNALAGYSMEV